MVYHVDKSILDEVNRIETYLDEAESLMDKKIYTGLESNGKITDSKLNRRRCYHCDKEFYVNRRDATKYVYQEFYNGKKCWFCSWTCLSRNRKGRNHD